MSVSSVHAILIHGFLEAGAIWKPLYWPHAEQSELLSKPILDFLAFLGTPIAGAKAKAG